MAFIIPDKILETLICNTCHKYLSVKPVKVYPNRHIKCGRCSRSKKQGDGIISLFGLVANNSLFKCINRYDGCRELLNYSQVRDHEKICQSRSYQCPLCSGDEKIPTFFLVKHFRDEHKSSVLDYPGFVVNFDSQSEMTELYMYIFEDDLFFIRFQYSLNESVMRLNISYNGDARAASNIHQKFYLYSDKWFKCTKKNVCTTLEADTFYSFSLDESDQSGMGKTVFIKFDLEVTEPTLKMLPSKLQHSEDAFDTVSIDSLSLKESCIIPTAFLPDVEPLPPTLKTLLSKLQHSEDAFDTVPMKSLYMNKSIIIPTAFSPEVEHLPPRKIHLSTTFLRAFPDISISSCGTALIQRKRPIFLHCFNCQEICWRGMSHDVMVQQFYVGITSEHSFCYFCFKYLKSEKKIRRDEYMVSSLPLEALKIVEFFCRWRCGMSFVGNEHIGHEESCSMRPGLICPVNSCFFSGGLIGISKHLRNVHGSDSYFYTHFYISSLFNRNIFVWVNNRFVFFQTNTHRDMKINTEVCRDGTRSAVVLLFNGKKEFLTSFKNCAGINLDDYWIKVILTKR
nr:uncharacterized protein LOC111512669 [Leptinotarsa decemlineata]XP_023024584.1 uncharacterized protein LOC111512669 [Leptinotarsa decemlineata]